MQALIIHLMLSKPVLILILMMSKLKNFLWGFPQGWNAPFGMKKILLVLIMNMIRKIFLLILTALIIFMFILSKIKISSNFKIP